MCTRAGSVTMAIRRRFLGVLSWVAVGVLGVSSPAQAAVQESGSVDGVAPAKEMTVLRVQVGSIAVDGRLDEEAWSRAEFRDDFRQKGKDRSFAPRVETSVAFAYDGEALYVGARMLSDRDGGPRQVLAGRDEAGNTERILVSLDTYRDRRTAFTFGVTVGGVRVDYVDARDNEGWRDDSWNPVWDARVTHDDQGWTAEMRIPFSQLRFSPGDQQLWGLNVRRWNPATFLNLYWVAVPYEETGWVSRFGALRGLRDIRTGSRIELVPYLLERGTRLDPADGVAGTTDHSTRLGGDMKAGLGPNLTLEATVNPDFGQVEADPARVNLTAFETFFPERRPFFTEGRELFRTRGPNYFYSRRIGSVPNVGGQGVFEEVESARIIGGAKLTGRMPDGLSVGALSALTGQESVPEPGAGARSEVAPSTLFAVGRVQQELGPSGSAIGLMATGVERFLADGGGLQQLIPRRALAGGADFVLRAADGRYEVTGFLGGSRVTGSADAMTRLQLSSTHFFQRPDQDHVRLDSTRTDLSGWAAGFTAGRVGGGEWRWDLQATASSPGFDIRDAGSQTRADRIEARVGVRKDIRDSRGLLRNHGMGLGFTGGWNFAGLRRQASPSAFFSATWANLWTTYLEAGMNLRALSDDLTRGGPLMGTARSWWVDAEMGSAHTGGFWWSLQADGFLDEFHGWSSGLSGGVTVQSGRRVELSLLAGGSLGDDSRLFLAAVDGGPEATFGTRYVFSRMERKEYFLQGRSRIAFAPDAVLTLYAEPFISTGGVHEPGELVAPRSRRLRLYGEGSSTLTRLDDGAWEVSDGDAVFRLENYDFWVRSFRATAVFRWEWRRGSSLFLIWQKNRWRFGDRMEGVGTDAFLDALRDPGQDILVAKVSVLLTPG